MASRRAQQAEEMGPTIASALVEKTARAGGTAKLLEIDGEHAVIELRFGSPKLSASGHSYVCGFGSVAEGALKINVTAFIPIPKSDRQRESTRVNDPRMDESTEQGAARRFYQR